MLLEFYLTVFAVSIVLILLGKYVDMTVGFIGGAILFILGTSIIFSPITMHVSDNINTTYVYYNDTSTHLNSTSEVFTPNYQELDTSIPHTGLQVNHFMGTFSAFAGVLAIVALVLGGKKKKKGDDD